MTDLPLASSSQASINRDKLVNFLNKIQEGYRREVGYHNDLHGADVAQMMHIMIKQADLATVANLNYLDLVSAITAAACHDYDHDGFNNSYHVNFMTVRALRYHDKAVQENWHASESLKVLFTQESNFMEAFSQDEKKVLRKRIIGMIIATDMADHMSHINVIDYKVKHRNISLDKNNGHLIVETSKDSDKFTCQQ